MHKCKSVSYERAAVENLQPMSFFHLVRMHLPHSESPEGRSIDRVSGLRSRNSPACYCLRLFEAPAPPHLAQTGQIQGYLGRNSPLGLDFVTGGPGTCPGKDFLSATAFALPPSSHHPHLPLFSSLLLRTCHFNIKLQPAL